MQRHVPRHDEADPSRSSRPIRRSRCVKHQAGQHSLCPGPPCPPWAPGMPCENFLYVFKAAPRAARAADTAGAAGLPLTLPPGWPQRRSAGAKTFPVRGRGQNRQESPGRGAFDKGTLAAALIGHCGQARSQPDTQTSVRAAAPCQIRRSVCAKLPHRRCTCTCSMTLKRQGFAPLAPSRIY